MHTAKEGAGSSTQEFGERFVSQGIKKSTPCHQRKAASLQIHSRNAHGSARGEPKNPSCATTAGSTSNAVPSGHTKTKQPKNSLKVLLDSCLVYLTTSQPPQGVKNLVAALTWL